MKKRTHKIFIKSGYLYPARSYGATPLYANVKTVVQIKAKLNFIKHCTYCM